MISMMIMLLEKFKNYLKKTLSSGLRSPKNPSVYRNRRQSAESINQRIVDSPSVLNDSNSGPFSLNDLISGIRIACDPAAQKKGLSLNLHFGPSIPNQLVGNHEELKEILTMIIEGSIQLTETGGLAITCMYHNGNAILSVSDTGLGQPSSNEADLLHHESAKNRLRKLGGTISTKRENRLGCIHHLSIPLNVVPETVQQVSEAEEMVVKWLQKYQDDPELTDVFYKGLGVLKTELAELNMAVDSRDKTRAAELIHAMKGFPGGFGLKPVYLLLLKVEKRIKAEPFDPIGSKDHIKKLNDLMESIPEKYFQVFDDISTGRFSTPGTSIKLSGKRKRILVAEDNRKNQEIVQYVLNRIHCDFRFVENGFEALAALERESFDLLLLDMQMPKLNGFETIKRIRTNQRLKHLPVIAVTASVLSTDQAACKAAGCDEFIPKPIIFEEMIHKIHMFLPGENEDF